MRLISTKFNTVPTSDVVLKTGRGLKTIFLILGLGQGGRGLGRS